MKLKIDWRVESQSRNERIIVSQVLGAGFGAKSSRESRVASREGSLRVGPRNWSGIATLTVLPSRFATSRTHDPTGTVL